MSTTQHPVIMQSSLALGRLELPPGSAAVNPRPPAKDACVQRPVVPQGPAHLNGCVPLTHQVAGHKYGVDKVGILQHPDGTVLKQLQPPPRGPREMQFYSMVFTADCSDPCLLELQNHLPKYYGTWSSPDCPNDLYLKLEDVTRRLVKPCIMDVKLGQRSYDPYASQDKREQQIRKYPLMEDIGFLVLGMRVYKVCNDSFDSYDQHYGRGLLKDTIKDGLATFFHNGVSLRKDAVWASMRRVQRILHWFESQTQLTFYASSLLFVYEGLPSSPSPLPPSIQPSLTAKNVMMSSTGDGAGDHEGKCVEEGAGQGELAEHNNNNNIQVCDYSLASRYTKHAKAVSHCANAVETSVSSGVCEEDNSPYNGNGNSKSLLEEREGEGGGEGLIDRGDGASEVEVRMIDFAHVFPSEGHDRGYIYGLKHLLTVLEQILCDAA